MKDLTGTTIDLCKDSTYAVSILEKLTGIDRNTMDVSSTPARKARKVYGRKNLELCFPMRLMA